MNHQKIYNEIIERGKTRVLNEYKENHHIIPKCLGGSNDKDNLVELTAREHFIVHKLLTEIYPDSNGLRFAVWIMVTMKDAHGRKYKIGNREYQRLRENIVVSEETKNIKKLQTSGKNNPMFGKTHSEESIRKNRESNLGQTRSEETRSKMRIVNSGKNNPMFGKKQKTVKCPHCGKTGGKSGMVLWHFDKCKNKE